MVPPGLDAVTAALLEGACPWDALTEATGAPLVAVEAPPALLEADVGSDPLRPGGVACSLWPHAANATALSGSHTRDELRMRVLLRQFAQKCHGVEASKLRGYRASRQFRRNATPRVALRTVVQEVCHDEDQLLWFDRFGCVVLVSRSQRPLAIF